jgi:uncharacterized alpha-E superfamily protein
MLSRIAESVYWMSRYLERAGNTARLMEINLLHLLEAEDVLPETAHWRPLLSIGASEDLYAKCYGGAPITARRTIQFVTTERENPSSIRNSLRDARENARVVRDRISKEMWEAMNELWLRLDRQFTSPLTAERAPAVYAEVRNGVARFHGLTGSTMMRGEAYGFYVLGSVVERADMTARIFDVKYHLLLPDLSMVGSPLDYYQWAALLKSLSGFEAYRRRYHSGLQPVDVAEFVIFEREFPRSLRFCAQQMRDALAAVGAPGGAASPSLARAETVLALLEDNSAESIFTRGLHEFLSEFLDRVAELHEALVSEYFAAYLGEGSCST